MHGKQLALDEIRLGRLAQSDRDVGLAHGEVELFVAGEQRDLDIGIEVEKFAEPRRQPMHAYASPEYLKRFGTPSTYDDLDKHRILLLGGSVPSYLQNRRWLLEVGRNGKGERSPSLTINNVLGVVRACQRGLGVAMLPDYLVEENGGVVQLFGKQDTLALDAFFVYPEELKAVARVQVFRDFLVANAQRWKF